MALNKFGELEGCPKCGAAIKPDWVACPKCATALKGDGKALSTERNRFICPGCGEPSSAQDDGLLCKTCYGFVHEGCQKLKLTGSFCPVCGSKLD